MWGDHGMYCLSIEQMSLFTIYAFYYFVQPHRFTSPGQATHLDQVSPIGLRDSADDLIGLGLIGRVWCRRCIVLLAREMHPTL